MIDDPQKRDCRHICGRAAWKKLHCRVIATRYASAMMPYAQHGPVEIFLRIFLGVSQAHSGYYFHNLVAVSTVQGARDRGRSTSAPSSALNQLRPLFWANTVACVNIQPIQPFSSRFHVNRPIAFFCLVTCLVLSVMNGSLAVGCHLDRPRCLFGSIMVKP